MAKRDSAPEALRDRLTTEQYYVTQEQGTEAPFTGKYHDCKDPGTYVCTPIMAFGNGRLIPFEMQLTAFGPGVVTNTTQNSANMVQASKLISTPAEQ